MDRQGARQVRENHEGQEDEQEVVDALGQERGDVRSDREGLPAVGVLTEEASSEEDVRIVVGEGSDEVRDGTRQQDGPLSADDHVQRRVVEESSDDDAEKADDEVHADGHDRKHVGCLCPEVPGHDVDK